MSWTYRSAVRRGRRVTVTIEDSATGSTKQFEYSYPFVPGQTQQEFKAEVKLDAREHIAALNAQAQEQDVTAEFSL